MGCETASGPDQVPVRGVAARLLSSVRGPEAKLRSRRGEPLERAFRGAEPDSSSEPAMRRGAALRGKAGGEGGAGGGGGGFLKKGDGFWGGGGGGCLGRGKR